jgi:hypothetical protein
LAPAREFSGSVATATEAPPAPTLAFDADFPEQYAYEILNFDLQRERRLVAAVEIVSLAPQAKLDTWSRPLAIGQPLPSLPVWLSETQTVSLDLEASYQETCRLLRIP